LGKVGGGHQVSQLHNTEQTNASVWNTISQQKLKFCVTVAHNNEHSDVNIQFS